MFNEKEEYPNMAASTASSLALPQLSATNFSNWKFRVECILEEKGVRECIDGIEEEIYRRLSEQEKKDYARKDARARSIIVQCVTDKHLEYIKDAKTSEDMMVSLKNIFERKSIFSKLYIRRKLLTLKCEGDDLQDHFVKFDTIIRELEATGSQIEENDKVCHLLLTMPEKYDNVITAIETMTTAITLEFVKSRLLDAELKFKNAQKTSKSEECSFSTNNIQKGCFDCGDLNHYIADCPKRKNSNNVQSNRGRGRGQRRGRAYFRRRGYNGQQRANLSSQEEEISFVAYSSQVESQIDGNFINFVLDSGATDHLVQESKESYMTDIKHIEDIAIKMANGEKLIARKKGVLRIKSGKNIIRIEALIVQNLAHNLLSVTKIIKVGKDVIFSKDKAVIKDKNGFSMDCYLQRNLFIARFKNVCEAKCMMVETKDVWHKRLGHLNRKGLKQLKLPYSEEICDSCMKGKATRLPFKRYTGKRSRRIGELLHTDIGGPIKTPTKEGERFYLTITDDFSHFCVVYLLKTKGEAKQYVIDFIEQLEANGNRVSRIRSDNGGEFSSKDFNTFCQIKGIRQEFTAAYTPQQNGLSERLNRTLLDKVRTMFADTNLPRHLWGEAIRCAAYLLNRSPTSALNGDIPAVKFYGKCDLDKLRIFGCKAWAFRLPKSDKLETRACEARMVGYSGSGYRLWDPINDNIFISRDVRFDESKIKYLEEEQEETEESEIKEKTDTVTDEETGKEERESDEENQHKEKRNVRPPKRFEEYEMYTAYCLLTEDVDPKSYAEAINLGEDWKKAISVELEAHKKYGTWTKAELPEGKKPIETKWVFRTKQDGIKKARLVAKGYQEEIMYNTYAPVARMATIRSLLSHALQNEWLIRQLDIPTAFLNGELQDETYITTPEGVEERGILKLNKALYGLQQAPACWNKRFNKFAQENNLQRSSYDFCFYFNKYLWLVIYVDDILITGHNRKVEEMNNLLKTEFSARDLGELRNFLGTEVIKTKDYLRISQSSAIDKILSKFNMNNCKGSKTPMEYNFQFDETEEKVLVPYRELIGSLMYLSTMTRPDISYATSYLSRFLDRPTNSLWKAGKRILRYLKETKTIALEYKKSVKNEGLLAFSDADWGREKVDRKSVSGFAVYYFGNLISWSSRKQQSVALSTAEAEYIAAATTATELIYLKGIVSSDLKHSDIATLMLIDNQSTIKMIESYENSKRSKHIDIKMHFIKDIVSKGLIKVNYVPTDENVADIFTKALCSEKFVNLRYRLCIC